jgi:hypothetical protein
MNIEVHAPTTLLLVVSLVLIVIAVLFFFVVSNTAAAFWMALAAYLVMGLGTIVKTQSAIVSNPPLKSSSDSETVELGLRLRNDVGQADGAE